MTNIKIHGEIEYVREDGMLIHSDICPPQCEMKNVNDPKWRKFVHDVLDEWLDKSNGTGTFYLKGE